MIPSFRTIWNSGYVARSVKVKIVSVIINKNDIDLHHSQSLRIASQPILKVVQQ